MVDVEVEVSSSVIAPNLIVHVQPGREGLHHLSDVGEPLNHHIGAGGQWGWRVWTSQPGYDKTDMMQQDRSRFSVYTSHLP